MKKQVALFSKFCLVAAALSILYLAAEIFWWAEQKTVSPSGETYAAQAERSILWNQRPGVSRLDPIILSTPGIDAAWPAMAIDKDGAIHIAWHGKEEGNYEIYYMKRSVSAGIQQGGGCGRDAEKDKWTRPLNVSKTSGSSARPSLAVGSDGRVHVAWSESGGQLREIYYAGADGRTWSKAVKISSSEGESTNPIIIVGNDGTAHLVWESAAGHRSDLYYSARSQAVWRKSINLTNNSAGMGAWFPNAIMDASQRLNLSWHDFRSGKPEIFHAFITDGHLANLIKASSGDGVSLNPSLFSGKDGAMGLVWVGVSGGGNEVFYARAVQGGWAERSIAAGPFKQVQSPVAVQAPSGAISIFFADRTDAGKSLMVVSRDGTKWKEPAKLWELNGPYALIKAAVDGKGSIHLLWSHGEAGKNSVYYSCMRP